MSSSVPSSPSSSRLGSPASLLGKRSRSANKDNQDIQKQSTTNQHPNIFTSGRNGTGYFSSLTNLQDATPKGYFLHHDIDTSNMQTLMEEWKGWMHTFRASAIQFLMGIANRKVDVVAAADEAFVEVLLKKRRKTLMEDNAEQLADNADAMTVMLRSYYTNDGQNQSLSEPGTNTMSDGSTLPKG